MRQVSVLRSAHQRARHCSCLSANSVKATGTPNKEQQCLDVWPSGAQGLFVGGVGRDIRISIHTYTCIKQMCISSCFHSPKHSREEPRA